VGFLKDVVTLIRKHDLYADLLIASPELDAEYANRNRSFSFSHAEIFTVKVDGGQDAVDSKPAFIEEKSLSHEPDRLTETTEVDFIYCMLNIGYLYDCCSFYHVTY